MAHAHPLTKRVLVLTDEMRDRHHKKSTRRQTRVWVPLADLLNTPKENA